MKTRISLVFVLLFCLTVNLKAQGFTKPSEGKAVIYFLQTAVGLGHTMYFEGEEFIGKCQGRNYIRLECEAGEHTFLAIRGASKAFLTTDFEAGKVYLISVREIEKMGAAAPQFKLVDPSKPKFAKRILTLVNDKSPVAKDEALEAKMKSKWSKFVTKAYNKFNTKQRAKNKHVHLGKDMFYSL